MPNGCGYADGIPLGVMSDMPRNRHASKNVPNGTGLRRWHSPRGSARYAQGAPRVQNGPNGTGLRRRCAPRRIVRQGRSGRATCGAMPTVCPSAYRAPGSPRSRHVWTYADGAALGVAVTAVTLTVPVSELRRRPVRRRVGPTVGPFRLRRWAALRRGPTSPRSYAERHRRCIVHRGQVGATPSAVGRRHLAGFL
jgi:hypothetical protein